MEKIKVGIIGCGGIANGKHMPALAKMEEVEMVAFCDIIEERAKEAAEEFGTEDARVYTDYTKLLEDEEIGAVHVLTPNDSHAPITVAALESGKHVMCEKPMAKTSEGARKMVEAANRTGNILTIGYQNRYRADSQYLHNACQEGELGNVYFAKAHAIRRAAVPTWGVFLDDEAQGGGPLIDIGTHALDLTLWMMNNYTPKYVVGTSYRELADNEEKSLANSFGPWDTDEFTVEDSAFGFVVMENGATVILESSWALNTLDVGEARTTLCGTLAGADMRDGLRINGQKYGKHYIEKPQLDKGGVDFYEGEAMSPADKEARTFYNAIFNGDALVVEPEQALVVTEILEGIYESARTGKPVYFNK
ncbi:MAG: Gfo/Idh/MocA family protein [Halanaerobiales bacterium]